MSSDRITPTMHYTSYVWVKNGLSPQGLADQYGKRLYQLLYPLDLLYKKISKHQGLERQLLNRHLTIDNLLTDLIKDGYEQVVELAAGNSGRGYRFAKKYPSLNYVEGDLPHASQIKNTLFQQNRLHLPNLSSIPIDVLQPKGELSLTKNLPPHCHLKKRTVIILEGLMAYLNRPQVEQMFDNFASFLGLFPSGHFISDLRFVQPKSANLGQKIFIQMLGHFVKGHVQHIFPNPNALEKLLHQYGFSHLTIKPTSLESKERHQLIIFQSKFGKD